MHATYACYIFTFFYNNNNCVIDSREKINKSLQTIKSRITRLYGVISPSSFFYISYIAATAALYEYRARIQYSRERFNIFFLAPTADEVKSENILDEAVHYTRCRYTIIKYNTYYIRIRISRPPAIL